MGTNMADQDELAQLEAERDRLLSMIAYQNGPFYRVSLKFRMLAWFGVLAVAIIFVIAGLVASAGQISASGLVFSVVGLALLAYILPRRMTVFDSPFFAGEILIPFGDGNVVRRPGEREAHQRLAECEARIVKLKDGRP
jgi:ABC-type multidrug transport system fused ATPase/permease subunit